MGKNLRAERTQRTGYQQFTVHNRHPEVAHMRQGQILIKDLRSTIASMKENDVELIVATTKSPFDLEIQEARLPKRFKLPAIKAYERKSDP